MKPYKWTFEHIYEESKKYKSLKELRKTDKRLYKAIFKYGVLDKLEWLEPIRHILNYDYVKKVASKYKTRKEFELGSNSAYHAALKNGWIDKLGFPSYEYASIFSIYSYEFKEYNLVYVGLTNNRERRDREHHGNTKRGMTTVRKFALEHKIENYKPIYHYANLSMQEAGEKEKEVLDLYISNGWQPLNMKKVGPISSSIGTSPSSGYTKEYIIEKINECGSMRNFRDRYRSLYYYASRNKMLKELKEKSSIKLGLYSTKNDRFRDSFDECKKEAIKYKTKSELNRKNYTLYTIMRKSGWLDAVFKKSVKKNNKIGYAACDDI